MKPLFPLQVRFWPRNITSGGVINSYHGINPGAACDRDLSRCRETIRRMAKDPTTVPGIYVIVDARGIPFSGFEVVNQVGGPSPNRRVVHGSNMGWAR